MIKRLLCCVVLLALSACADNNNASSTSAATISPADKVALIYAPVRLLAVLCTRGVPPCEDLNARSIVAAALPVVDTAVAEATKQMKADPSRGNIEKWSSYAVSAINVLSDALAASEPARK